MKYNGVTYASYREAAAARGLLDDDAMHAKIMEDAALCQMPSQLRHTFALLLMWDPPVNPQALWDEYTDDLAEDFVYRKRLVRHQHLFPNT